MDTAHGVSADEPVPVADNQASVSDDQASVPEDHASVVDNQASMTDDHATVTEDETSMAAEQGSVDDAAQALPRRRNKMGKNARDRRKRYIQAQYEREGKTFVPIRDYRRQLGRQNAIRRRIQNRAEDEAGVQRPVPLDQRVEAFRQNLPCQECLEPNCTCGVEVIEEA